MVIIMKSKKYYSLKNAHKNQFWYDNNVSDVLLTGIEKEYEKERFRNHRNGEIKKKNKLKRTWQDTGNRFFTSCYPVDKSGNYTNDKEQIAYYKETNKSRHAKRFRYYKNQSNRAVRRYFNVVLNTRTFDSDNEIEMLDNKDISMIYYSPDIDDSKSLGTGKSTYKKVY